MKISEANLTMRAAIIPAAQKWSFLLRISSANMTKSVGNCGFGHIYWINP